MTSLAYIFTMERPWSRLFFGSKMFIFQQIFNFLWHFLRLLGNKRMIRSHLAGGVSEQVDVQKGSFQRMV